MGRFLLPPDAWVFRDEALGTQSMATINSYSDAQQPRGHTILCLRSQEGRPPVPGLALENIPDAGRS